MLLFVEGVSVGEVRARVRPRRAVGTCPEGPPNGGEADEPPYKGVCSTSRWVHRQEGRGAGRRVGRFSWLKVELKRFLSAGGSGSPRLILLSARVMHSAL